MIRQTSIEAYNFIKENGSLGVKRWEVYDVLFKHGPLSASEIYNILKKQNEHKFVSKISLPNWNTRARLTELREMGVAIERGIKVCSVSGRNVILWDVTKNLPKKLDKDKSKKPTRKHLEKCRDALKKVYMHRDLPENIKEFIEKMFMEE